MPTYMLTWNPRQQRPANLDEPAAQVAQGGSYRYQWSAGNRRHLAIGSRLFLVRQGKPPKGIVASGYSISEPAPTDDPGDHANYVELDFTMVLRGEDGQILPLEVLLDDEILKEVNWASQRGGIQFTEDQAAQLEVVWQEYLRSIGRTEIHSRNE